VFDEFERWRRELFDDAGTLHFERLDAPDQAAWKGPWNDYFRVVRDTNPGLLDMVLRTMLVPDPAERSPADTLAPDLKRLYRGIPIDNFAKGYGAVTVCAQPTAEEQTVLDHLMGLRAAYLT
jgi:hypothetical protein